MSYTPALLSHELENEINETLSSVLLWMRYSALEDHAPHLEPLNQAETNLIAAIGQIRTMRSLLNKMP